MFKFLKIDQFFCPRSHRADISGSSYHNILFTAEIEGEKFQVNTRKIEWGNQMQYKKLFLNCFWPWSKVEILFDM